MNEPKQHPEVSITADDDTVVVVVKTSGGTETLKYEIPGMLTGSDLRDVLAACGIEAEYTYDEGDGGMFSGEEEK